MKRSHHDSNNRSHHGDRRHSGVCEQSAETKAAVVEFNESIREQAFHAIKSTLPCKIIELTEILLVSYSITGDFISLLAKTRIKRIIIETGSMGRHNYTGRINK